ncbi:MAG: lytic transglycosylase domain-containing protein [Bryobacteraceae bacterium]|jgi:soluble lytic murein transglycosylase-like protein
MRISHLIGLVLLALPIHAGEYAVLGNGFRLHAERHEVEDGKIRLYAEGGVSEMPAASVVRFEAEEEVAPANLPAAPPATVPPTPPAPQTPAELAAAAAEKYSLPASFVESVMRAESGFQPSAVSPKGAIGLMQLMPETARQLGVDPANPRQNAEGGAQYLHDLLAKYEQDPDQVVLALAAYNAGPAAVERYHGVPPYRETREYILRVLKDWNPGDGK